MKRKIFSIKEVNKQEADMFNRSFEELYQHKTEEVLHTNSATETLYRTYRSTETGLKNLAFVTATSINLTIPFQTKYTQIFSINLDPIGSAFTPRISSFTGSEMVISIDATSTASQIKFFWKVTGSQE